ncbi:MAG: hypothetical protein M0T74_03410 [Desulfitobacterium hafniense]|nr:hypothetical protein [Desulfitobacterium hafniense]
MVIKNNNREWGPCLSGLLDPTYRGTYRAILQGGEVNDSFWLGRVVEQRFGIESF